MFSNKKIIKLLKILILPCLSLLGIFLYDSRLFLYFFEEIENVWKSYQEDPELSETEVTEKQIPREVEVNELSNSEKMERSSEQKNGQSQQENKDLSDSENKPKNKIITELKKYAPYIIGAIVIGGVIYLWLNSGNSGGVDSGNSGGGNRGPAGLALLLEPADNSIITRFSEQPFIPEMPENFIDFREGHLPGSREAVVSILKYVELAINQEEVDHIVRLARYDAELWQNRSLTEYEVKFRDSESMDMSQLDTRSEEDILSSFFS